MLVRYRDILDKQFLPNEVYKVYKVLVTSRKEPIHKLLNNMHDNQRRILQNNNNACWLLNPLNDVEEKPILTTYYYFETNKEIDKLIARQGTLLQQLDYISLVGETERITRDMGMRVALTYHKFCNSLAKMGIINPSLTEMVNGSIKRIHAVHPSFLDDEEISAGLFIPQRKNTIDNQVLYVCSQETLELALQCCLDNSKLTIDGHWEHAKKSTHGVWEDSNSQQIASHLKMLLSRYPEKINAIRLLGCQAGLLADFSYLQSNFNPDFLLFKDDCLPNHQEKNMAEFRNSAAYFSQSGEFPFAVNSLAGEIVQQINNTTISVTANSSLTYPFPPGEKGLFNIGSDGEDWKGPPMWQDSAVDKPSWYQKLHRSKITCTRESYSPLFWKGLSSSLSVDNNSKGHDSPLWK